MQSDLESSALSLHLRAKGLRHWIHALSVALGSLRRPLVLQSKFMEPSKDPGERAGNGSEQVPQTEVQEWRL